MADKIVQLTDRAGNKVYPVAAVANELFGRIYPVGSIYISVNAANPSSYFPGTTWEAFGQGKTMVGVDTSDSDFNTVQKTGGYKATRHATYNPPLNSANSMGANQSYMAAQAEYVSEYLTGDGSSSELKRSVKIASVAGNIGNDAAARLPCDLGRYEYTSVNLQPYITVYMWRRTA